MKRIFGFLCLLVCVGVLGAFSAGCLHDELKNACQFDAGDGLFSGACNFDFDDLIDRVDRDKHDH